MALPAPRLRSVDLLLRRTFARLVWVLSGAMALLGLVQFGIPTLPRSQGRISLGLAAALALLAFLLRRLRPSRAALDLFWLLAMTAVSASLALRVLADPAPLRPFLLLIALPMAGVFIRGRAASLLLWSSQVALVLLAWGLAQPRLPRPDLMLPNLVFFTGLGMWLQHLVGDLLARMEARIHRLAEARREIHALEGMIPICAHCKKVRNDKGYWEQVEGYLTRRNLALFSHGICPDCLAEVRHEAEALRKARHAAP